MPYCSACGEELGPPPEVLHDPDNHFDIVEGGVSNPDDHHIRAEDGPKGARLFCSKTGQTTKIENEAPPDGSGSGGDRPPKQTSGSGGGGVEVYDLPEESSAMDILEEVISTPVFGLDQDQIQEVISWGDIYDGQVPPDVVQNLLKNMKGVSKQKASLMRQKYEAKLNKWVQKQSRDTGGPSIGVSASPPMPQNNGGAQPSQPSRGGEPQSPDKHPKRPPQPEPDQSGRGMDLDTGEDLREQRRKRRIERRNDAMDVAAERFAEQATQQMAQDIGGIFGDIREVAHIAFKKKAEKDPDWFFEKMDKWDMEIVDAVLSPSEAMKEDQQSEGGGGMEGFDADLDVDEVMSSMEETGQEPAQEEPTETTNRGGAQEVDEHPMTASPQDIEEPSEEEGDDDDAFEELMGDVTTE